MISGSNPGVRFPKKIIRFYETTVVNFAGTGYRYRYQNLSHFFIFTYPLFLLYRIPYTVYRIPHVKLSPASVGVGQLPFDTVRTI